MTGNPQSPRKQAPPGASGIDAQPSSATPVNEGRALDHFGRVAQPGGPIRLPAVYCRVSTGKEEQRHGLVTQAQACKDFLRRLPFPMGEAKVYEDEGSGRKGNRPALRRLLHDAAMHRFQILVVFKLDRLSRGGIAEMFRVLKALQGYGVRVYSVCETWWDPAAPTAELILAVLAWAAEFESKAIGERVAAGIATRRAESEQRGERFLWGRALVSPLRNDPTLPLKALQLRKDGLSWTKMALWPWGSAERRPEGCTT